MKRIVSIVLVTLFLFALSAFCFGGCGLFKSISLEEAKSNLESAGYEVTVMSGDDFVDLDDNGFPTITSSELKNYLYAVKGEDLIHIFFFYTTDDASDNADFIDAPKLLRGQTNEVVYLGTKQAQKDAKI